MKKHIAWILLLIILIIASFLRLYQLKTVPPGLYPDEAMNGNNALEALRTQNWKVFYSENNGREGLFINIQSGLMGLISLIGPISPINEPWVLRLPSAIFGILTVLGVFFIARELFGESSNLEARNSKQIQNSNIPNSKPFRISDFGFRISRSDSVALLSSFLIATSFWHINFSRIGFRAIMAPFFLTWALFFLLRGFNMLRQGLSFRRATFFHLVGGVIFGLGVYSYIAYRVAPVIALPTLYFYWRKAREEGWQRKFFHTTAHFILLSVIVFIPLGLYFLQTPGSFFGRTSEVSVFSSPTPIRDLALNIIKTLGMFNFVGDWNWRHNVAGAPELYWPIGVLFILGIILGIKSSLSTKSEALNPKQYLNSNSSNSKQFKISNLENSGLFRDSSFRFGILFFWFILALLPVVISNEGIPHALRSILLIPPTMIFAGYGGIWLYYKIATKYENNTNIRKMLFALCTLLFAILAIEAYHTYFVQWAKNPNIQGAFAADYVALGKQLNDIPAETPKYVIVKVPGVNVRGLPMPTQTIMFITDTFSPVNQKVKNIHYVLPEQEKNIPIGALKFYIK